MSELDFKLDIDTASDIAAKYLTHLLDTECMPEERQVQFMLACQEVLHFIMLPEEWEERFERDFLEYAENAD